MGQARINTGLLNKHRQGWACRDFPLPLWKSKAVLAPRPCRGVVHLFQQNRRAEALRILGKGLSLPLHCLLGNAPS